MELHLLIIRVVHDLVARVHGPMTFRLILQPLSAAIPALKAGLHDARSGGPRAFFVTLNHPELRKPVLRQGWRDVFKVFVLAIVIDLFYSVTVIHWIYPAETLTVAALLAVVPYAIVRVSVNMIASAVIRIKAQNAGSSVPMEIARVDNNETQI